MALKWERHYNQSSVIAKLWRETWNETRKTAAKNPSKNFRFRFYGDPDPKKLNQLLKCGAKLEQITIG